MKIKLVILLLLFSVYSFSKETYTKHKSSKYGYTIEYPSTFIKKEAKGKHIDLKVVNKKGYSIIVIVNTLLPQEKKLTISDLLKIPDIEWEQSIQMPNMKIVKKGKCLTDQGREGVFLNYTEIGIEANAVKLYHMNYIFLKDGLIYNVNATCDVSNISTMQSVFFRTLQSFTIN